VVALNYPEPAGVRQLQPCFGIAVLVLPGQAEIAGFIAHWCLLQGLMQSRRQGMQGQSRTYYMGK
jgi:hypothetical protein